VPSATAVKQVEVPFDHEDRSPADLDAAPGSEFATYRPRFRVVTRRPLAAAPARVSPAHRASLYAAVPALCLLVYVLFWTMAMRGGYYRDQIREQIQALKIEQAELEAEKRRLQLPGYILSRAAQELQMEPAGRREFTELPAPEQVAVGRGPGKNGLGQPEPGRLTR
jgi:hypothetical protein